MTATDWTDEKVERMTALWREGASAGAIARKLGGGVTRNAVLGKLHRLGINRAAAAAPRRVTVARAPVRGASIAPAARSGSAVAAAVAAAACVDVSQAPAPALTTLLAVRLGACRWPCGDRGGGDLAVCGREASRGAYCAGHAAVAYQNRRPVSLFALAGLPEG